MMSIEFEDITKNKIAVIWTNDNDLKKYHVGNIKKSIFKFNDMSIDELKKIVAKMEELQNEPT